ncbi:hypothetical protein EV121DRAFT_290529 [Schizophyllum commune]
MDINLLLLLYALLLQHYTLLVADLGALVPLLAHPIDLFDALANSFFYIATTLIRQLLATALIGRGPHRLACRLIVVFALTVTSAVATTLCGFAWLSRWAWGALCALVGIPGMAGLGISEVLSFLTTDHVLAEGLLHYLTIVMARSARGAPPPPTGAPWTSNSSEADATTFGSHADAAERAAPVTPEPRYTSVVDEWRHAVYTDEDFQEDDAMSTSATISSDSIFSSDLTTSSLALVLYNGSTRSSFNQTPPAAGHALVPTSNPSMPTTPFRRAQQSITAPARIRLCEPVPRLLLTPSAVHAEDHDAEMFFAAGDTSLSSSQSSSPSSLFDAGRSLTPFTMLTSPESSPMKPLVKKSISSVACQTDDLLETLQLDAAESAKSDTVEEPRPSVVAEETLSTEPRAEQTQRCGSLLFCDLTSAQIESLLVRSKPIQRDDSNDVAIEIRVDVETVVVVEETCPVLTAIDLDVAAISNTADAPEAISVPATDSLAPIPLPSIAPPSIIITPPSPGEQRAEVVNGQDEQVLDGSKDVSAPAEGFASVPPSDVAVSDDAPASTVLGKPASSDAPEHEPSTEVPIPIPSPTPFTKTTPPQSLDSDRKRALANIRLPALEEQRLNKGFRCLSIVDDCYPIPERFEKYPLAAPTLPPRYCTPGRYVPNHSLVATFVTVATIPAESMAEVELTETVELMVTEPVSTSASIVAALPPVLEDVDVVMDTSPEPIVQKITQIPDQIMALPQTSSGVNLPLQPQALATTPPKSDQPTMSQCCFSGTTSIASASKGKAVDPAERPHDLQGISPHANRANPRRCASQQNAQQPSATQVWSEHMRVAAHCEASETKPRSPSRVDRHDDTPGLKTRPTVVVTEVSRPPKRRAESMDRADQDVDDVEEGQRRREFRTKPSLPVKAASSHPMRTRSKPHDLRRDAHERAWRRRVSHEQRGRELQQVPWPKRALPGTVTVRREETSSETIVNSIISPAASVKDTNTVHRRDIVRRAIALAGPTPDAPRKRRANRMETEDEERPQKRLRFVQLPVESAKASRPQKALRRHRRDLSPSASRQEVANVASQPPSEAQQRPSSSTQQRANKQSQPVQLPSSRASELAARRGISVHELSEPSERLAGRKRTARDAGLPTMSREKSSAANNAVENEILDALLEETCFRMSAQEASSTLASTSSTPLSPLLGMSVMDSLPSLQTFAPFLPYSEPSLPLSLSTFTLPPPSAVGLSSHRRSSSSFSSRRAHRSSTTRGDTSYLSAPTVDPFSLIFSESASPFEDATACPFVDWPAPSDEQPDDNGPV